SQRSCQSTSPGLSTSSRVSSAKAVTLESSSPAAKASATACAHSTFRARKENRSSAVRPKASRSTRPGRLAEVIVICRQAVGLGGQALGDPQIARRFIAQVDDLVPRHRLLDAVEQQQDTRPRALNAILLNDDTDFAALQFDQRPDRIEADALDELLHQRRVELAVALVIDFLERSLVAEGTAVGLVFQHRAESIHQAGHFPGQADLLELQAA